MRIAVFGDLHLGVRYDGVDRTADIVDAAMAMADAIEEEHPDLIVCLGDLFHHGKPNAAEGGTRTIRAAIRVLDRLGKIAHVFWVVGNHDVFEREDYDDGPGIFENHDRIIVLRKPGVLSILYGGYALPHLPRYLDASQFDIPAGTRLYFGHLNLVGMLPGGADKIERGHENTRRPMWPLEKMIAASGGQQVHVFGGHYHSRQVVDRENIRFYFPGSLARFAFGEGDESKGFMVVDTDRLLEGE